MSKVYHSISTGLVLELVKKLAAELGTGIDTEACQQIQNHTYVDDGAGGGSQDQVERFHGRLVMGLTTVLWLGYFDWLTCISRLWLHLETRILDL